MSFFLGQGTEVKNRNQDKRNIFLHGKLTYLRYDYESQWLNEV
uniref:PH domain-containing protein n=1 Tax=Heterorhabditis bacteriophora TaxID=37862 RepID=A0A1I7WGA9_HETBA